MLVDACPVEASKAPGVLREVRRHPVQKYAYPHLVQHVDHVHEVLRRAVPARGGEVAESLIPPRGVEGVLHHGKQLHMCEADVKRVLPQLVPEFPVGEGAETLGGLSSPRADVHLVYRHRRVERVALAPVLHPVAVVPLVLGRPDYGGGLRRYLPEGRERIALLHHRPGARPQGELVERALPHAGDEPLPNPGAVLSWREVVPLPVPVVEGADHADLLGVRRPEGEAGTSLLPVIDHLCAELLVQSEVVPLPEQV